MSTILRQLDALGATVLRLAHTGLRDPNSSDDPWLQTTDIQLEGRAVRVHHRVARAGAPTVLALPGYPDTLQVFARLASALDPHTGFLALDFPGQGRSAPSLESHPTFAPADRTRWLAALLDTLSLAHVHLYAHDMGAHTALEFALTHPSRVRSLVVSNALLDGTGPTSTAIRVLRRARAYRVLLPTAPQVVVARSVATFLPRDALLTPRVAFDVADAFTPRAARTTVAVCDAAETWLARGLDRFARITAPVTLLWGRDEAHFPFAHAVALARVLPHARCLDPVNGGHHWLAWHDPSRVARVLLTA